MRVEFEITCILYDELCEGFERTCSPVLLTLVDAQCTQAESINVKKTPELSLPALIESWMAGEMA
jgi:hypothetical protein